MRMVVSGPHAGRDATDQCRGSRMAQVGGGGGSRTPEPCGRPVRPRGLGQWRWRALPGLGPAGAAGDRPAFRRAAAAAGTPGRFRPAAARVSGHAFRGLPGGARRRQPAAGDGEGGPSRHPGDDGLAPPPWRAARLLAPGCFTGSPARASAASAGFRSTRRTGIRRRGTAS